MNELGLGLVLFAIVLAVTAVLATHATRRTALTLVLFGLLAAALKIWLFQQTPQWQDINPDSITYDLNARAFAEHWRGHAVEGQSHRLRGLLEWHAAGLHDADWVATDKLTYAAVGGSHEWLYAAYIALWYWLTEATQPLVIWSNALWAAFFPAAAFGIALSLGAGRRVALAASGLALLDPSSGVNASWLLKDTLAGFLAMAVLWALLAYLREGGKARIVIAALALGGLGGVRFVAFLALVIAAVMVSVWLLFRDNRRKSGLAIFGVVFSAWLMNGLLAQVPHFSFTGGSVSFTGGSYQGVEKREENRFTGGSVSFTGGSAKTSIVVSPARVASGGIAVLRANTGDVTADDTVLSWKNALLENPVYAIVRSVAHTLFAPYPWVAISPGLTWVSFSELYYPGVILWMLCLPGIFTALAGGIRQRDPVFWLLALFLAALLAAYTIWLGEWSTRQRVFALPAFFALAAMGWAQLWAWVDSVRARAVANRRP